MNDHVTLMQIDCSVVNTSLVKLKSNALPESVRKSANGGTDTAPEHKRENITNTHKEKINASALENSTNAIRNYSNNQKLPDKDIGVGKDDLFAHYLFSKYENVKDDSAKRPRKNVDRSIAKSASNDSLNAT